MGAPSQEQIEEIIADGIARGASEEDIVAEVKSLSRLSDEELDAELAGRAVSPSCVADRAARSSARPVPGPTAAPVATGVPPSPAEGQEEPIPPAFNPASIRPRRDGWTADRQRAFIAALCETGCVSEACAEVGLTPRSAYRLREHPAAEGFRAAWTHAEAMATSRLVAIAFDRAIHGSVERIYKDGELTAEKRKPSDRLLMWLLAHHDPATYGWLARPPREGVHPSFYPVRHARTNMAAALDQLSDVSNADCPAERVGGSDFDFVESDAPIS